MRVVLVLATAGLLAGSLSAARAGEWCGFLDKDHAPVHCGYSSLNQCQQALLDQKGAYRMPSPDFAQTKTVRRRG